MVKKQEKRMHAIRVWHHNRGNHIKEHLKDVLTKKGGDTRITKGLSTRLLVL